MSTSNKHGLRCTAEDYKQAVALALETRPDVSDREIARHLGISHPTVAKYRPSGKEAGASETRTGRDGRKYPVRPPADVAVALHLAAKQLERAACAIEGGDAQGALGALADCGRPVLIRQELAALLARGATRS